MSNKRQAQKAKQKEIKDRYFLVNWLEEDDSDLYDVVHSKTIVPPEGFDILDINVGSVCRVSFDGKFYKARVIDYGFEKEMKRKQKEIEMDPLLYVLSITNNEATGMNHSEATVEKSYDAPKLNSKDHASSETVLSELEDVNPSGSDDSNKLELSNSNVPKPNSKDNVSCVLQEESSSKSRRVSSTDKSNYQKLKSSGSKMGVSKVKCKKISSGSDTRSLSDSLAVSSGLEPFSCSFVVKPPMKKRKRKILSMSLSDDDDDDAVSYGEQLALKEITNKKKEVTTKSVLKGSSKHDNRKKCLESFSESDDEISDDPVVVTKETSLLSHKKLTDAAKKEWQYQHFTANHSPKFFGSSGANVSLKEFQDLQQKVAKLEGTVGKLKKKLKLQETTKSSSEDSFTEEKESSTSSEESIKSFSSVNKLKLEAAKLHPVPSKCALNLMSSLFSIEELVNGNPAGVTNSKDETRKRTIKQLDPIRMQYIQTFIESKWPGEYQKIQKKLTQKCTDMYKNHSELRYT